MSKVIWSKEEDARLQLLYPSHSQKELSVLMGRSVAAVRHRCSLLGLNTKSSRWTEEQDKQLLSWYEARQSAKLETPVIAEKLGKTVDSVHNRAAELGITQLIRKTGRKDRRKYGDRQEFLKVLPELVKDRWKNKEHPRGATGMKRTPEHTKALLDAAHQWQVNASQEEKDAVRDKQQQTLLKRYGTLAPSNLHVSNPYSRTKYGKREDLNNQFFRSSWEANYARYLNFLIQHKQIEKWEYEPDTFWFEKIRRGVRSYTPDFKIYRPDGTFYYVEVKGWMDDKSKTKLKRMKIYHPTVEIDLVDSKRYRAIQKQCSALIPMWE